MDMQTDTTMQLDAQAAKAPTPAAEFGTPPRASAALTEALGTDSAAFLEKVERFAEAIISLGRAAETDAGVLDGYEAGLQTLCPDHAQPSGLAIWEKIARDLKETSVVYDLDMSCENIADCEYEAGIAYRAAVKAGTLGARIVDQYLAQIAVERLARSATEGSIYRGYADRPAMLADLAGRIAAIQDLSRSFSDGYESPAPWLLCFAKKVVFDEVWNLDALPHQQSRLLAAE